jgi:uncharacterized protein (TIGR03083 family)
MTTNTTIPRATDIPMTSRADAGPVLDGVLAAIDRQIGDLDPADASLPTDCSRWDVRAMIAHVVASTEEVGRPGKTVGRMMTGHRRHRDLNKLDARNELHTELFDGQLPALHAQLRTFRSGAVARVNRLPRPLDGVRVSSGVPDLPKVRLGHLVRVIFPRDTWMHGIDLAEATGKPRVGGAHDAVLVEQVLRDLALSWSGPAIDVTVTGAYEARWLIGSGSPVAELSADAVGLCRSLAGRPADDPVTLRTGDPAAVQALEAARILF